MSALAVAQMCSRLLPHPALRPRTVPYGEEPAKDQGRAIVKTCGSACWAGRDHRLDRASQGAEDGVHVRLQMEGFEHCQELAFLVAEVGLHDGGDSLEVAVKLGRAGAVIHRLL